MVSADEALWWLPTLAVAAVAVVGVVVAAAQPARRARTYWLATALAVGAAAFVASAWQQSRSRATLATESARLRAFGVRVDELGRLLPAGPGKTPGETFDTAATTIRTLNARIAALQAENDKMQRQTRRRIIDPQTVEKLADYLRGRGSHQVVVSCAPDDIEAFAFANQIANILRDAGWEALGPEKTTIFGEAPALGVTLYVRPGTAPPEAATILIDAFARFNIPLRSGLTPSDAIPDPMTTELYVSHK